MGTIYFSWYCIVALKKCKNKSVASEVRRGFPMEASVNLARSHFEYQVAITLVVLVFLLSSIVLCLRELETR